MDINAILALVLVVVVLTALAIRVRPEVVRTYFFEPLEQGRLLGALLIGVILVWTWLRSGVGWKMVVSLLLIAFAVAFVVFEQPHKDIR